MVNMIGWYSGKWFQQPLSYMCMEIISKHIWNMENYFIISDWKQNLMLLSEQGISVVLSQGFKKVFPGKQ